MGGGQTPFQPTGQRGEGWRAGSPSPALAGPRRLVSDEPALPWEPPLLPTNDITAPHPCPLLPTQTTATSEGPGMVIGKLFWFLLVWLPRQVVILEKGVFPKE